ELSRKSNQREIGCSDRSLSFEEDSDRLRYCIEANYVGFHERRYRVLPFKPIIPKVTGGYLVFAVNFMAIPPIKINCNFGLSNRECCVRLKYIFPARLHTL